MRAVKDGAEVKPGSSLELKPGGYHLMLIDLKKPLEEGAMVPLTITLAKAAAINVDIKVGEDRAWHCGGYADGHARHEGHGSFRALTVWGAPGHCALDRTQCPDAFL